MFAFAHTLFAPSMALTLVILGFQLVIMGLRAATLRDVHWGKQGLIGVFGALSKTTHRGFMPGINQRYSSIPNPPSITHVSDSLGNPDWPI